MTKKLTSRLLSVLVSLCMVLALVPTTAFAAEGDVAKIDDTTYATLDAAVEAAAEGATIELLQDCELTKGFNKSLTFTGNGTITINKQLTSNGEGWMCFGLYDPNRVLTFDGSGVKVEWNSEVGTAPWLMLSLSGTMNVTNGAKVTFNVDSGSTGSRNAIYMNAGSSINVTNGSTFVINGYATGGKEGQGIQLDQKGTAEINVRDNSTFEINGTNRGYVNSPEIYVDNSVFTVKNCTNNASNGGTFTAVNSIINYTDNAVNGLSAGNLTSQGSQFTCTGNGGYGIAADSVTVDGTSVLDVSNNATMSGFAGFMIRNSGTIKDGAKVTINGNQCKGLYLLNAGCNVTIEEGVDLTIMNNYDASYGGGIRNQGASLTLPSDAKIYNNHAGTAGDDIYCSHETTNITIGPVGADWVLDDCSHNIDGWYIDNENARWDADGIAKNVTEETDTSFVGVKALKAAHGLDSKTSYPGMDKQVQTSESAEWDDSVSSATGATVNFKLNTNIPNDLLNYIIPDVNTPETAQPDTATMAVVPVEERGKYELTIHDQMDTAFTDMKDLVVTIDREGTDTDVTLASGTQYTYVTGTGDGCTFHITLDLVALYESGVITDTDIENATPITVTYSATLKEGTAAGTYHNTAWVAYPEDESSKDTVDVDTYGIKIFKYDQADNEKGLPGAVFTLYSDEACQNVIATATSNADGFANFAGLAAGTYYLKETQAPDGYICSEEVVTVMIPDQAGEDNIVNVNFANTLIPHTGGTGTMMYTIGGVAIIVLAGVLLVVYRKSRKKQER